MTIYVISFEQKVKTGCYWEFILELGEKSNYFWIGNDGLFWPLAIGWKSLTGLASELIVKQYHEDVEVQYAKEIKIVS
jgi:hypothetical protein